MTTKKPPSIETSLKELNKIVEKLEKGNVPLEEALNQFEKGITLSKQCQTSLDKAEQKIEKLVHKNGHELLLDVSDEYAEEMESDDE